MVYERLLHPTHHIAIDIPVSLNFPEHTASCLTLTTHSTSINLLATCRQFHQEALPFINKSIRDWVTGGGVKVITTRRHISVDALPVNLRATLDTYAKLGESTQKKVNANCLLDR
jgi:hypothetical protein